MSRRKFVKRTVYGGLGLGLLSGLYAWQIEPFWLEFVERKMPIKNLPDHLIGKRLMQISDIHVSENFDYHFIIESFQKAQKFKPDLVVYTGDYISYSNKKQFKKLKEVLKYAVRGNLGTAGILGNHDYGHDWSEEEVANSVLFELKNAGIQMLRNEQIEISGLNIIGFDDLWGINFRPELVMNNYDSSKANLVLCHNPDVCDLDVWNGYQGWILSGHTHGGQCKPPFLKAPLLPVNNKKYDQGEIDLEDGRTLYINRALGHLYQIRFNVRPEITIFALSRA